MLLSIHHGYAIRWIANSYLMKTLGNPQNVKLKYDNSEIQFDFIV